ncbi:hypothetical protein L4F37_18145 [Vibrio cholerae]|nr:hypothetical protein [Vibrio cholerae]MCO7072245.1 hypothetical protein [Vibrio cholerae]
MFSLPNETAMCLAL